MRPLLPSVALVTAVFLLGCQEGSSPVEAVDLEPQFGKPVPGEPHIHDGGGDDAPDLIEGGRRLFFEETFAGNGRTCGTCHRAENNFTIDVAFIADLHATNPMDPLFVAEFVPALSALESGGATGLLRTNGLILANIQGFENPPFFRAPPSLFNLSVTAPYGLSGNVPDLREFSTGAVMQHFPLTLTREVGVDFRLPTEAELDSLEAFMLSLESPSDGNFKVSGRNSILSTVADPRARDTSRPEVNGRNLLSSVGCTGCHLRSRTAFSGGNLNTGVESLISFGTGDTGNGFGSFQTPGLFGLRKAAFFHNNAVGNNTTPLAGKTLQFTNLRDAVAFYTTAAFTDTPIGVFVTFDADDATKNQQIDDITAFLVAISAL